MEDYQLRTNESENTLFARLLKTYRDAQASLEEQGVNILFVALGMLEWYESDTSEEIVKSPLILIPVLIERGRGNKFKIKYEGTETGTNLSLEGKLEQDFRIRLPDIMNPDDLDLKEYFKLVEKAISQKPRWRINDKSVVLSFFSYNKYIIYKDLSGTLWPDEIKPWNNQILENLLDKGFDDSEQGITEEEELDKHRPLSQVHEVVNADSSQILALLEARSGRSMLIEGPPGTGKSQTITNLIAEALGEGKKVLFVSEKKAALEVVWRNLEKVGLHEACLELHSNKTNKKAFYTRIKETVELGKPQTERVEAEIRKLEEARDTLNSYCHAVHDVIVGRKITPIQAMGRLVALGETKEDLIKLDFSMMSRWDYEMFEQQKDLVARIQYKIEKIGCPARNPFYDSKIELFLPDDERALKKSLSEAKDKINLAFQSGCSLADKLRIQRPADYSDIMMICKAADIVADSPNTEGVSVGFEGWQNNEGMLRTILRIGIRYSEIKQNLDSTIKPEAWDADLEADRQFVSKYKQKIWRMLVKNYRVGKKKLKRLYRINTPKDIEELLAGADVIIESQIKRRYIRDNLDLCQKYFGKQWRGEDSDWDALLTILDWVLELYRKIEKDKLPKELLTLFEERYDRLGLIQEASNGREKCEYAIDHMESILDFLKAGDELKKILLNPISSQLALIDIWLSDFSSLENLRSYNYLVKEAHVQGLGELIHIADHWPMAGEKLVEVLKRCWYNGVLREAFEQRPSLAGFDRQFHESVIATFEEYDRLLLDHNRSKLLLKHWEGVPRYKGGGSLGILQREFAKKRRHRAIRHVMAEAGEVIQAIKPVFMMSPISVAMYIPPKGPKFDMVIFDEASQVKPEDAFSAIIRADQAIVVGDSKQLPPTNFFEIIANDEEEREKEIDEINVTRDIESILALMSSKIPSKSPRRRELRWHYRSQHDSLIAPSNRLFYRDRLIVFPNPERHCPGSGFIFHYHPETVYGRGESKKNQDEARIIASMVRRHVQENPGQSLGVVAFSLPQQEAIQNEIERIGNIDQVFSSFDKNHPTEPLFVKNLETVQGDERDVIFVSIGFGRDKDGFVSMNFGPVNKDGGERRLNVLFTRARLRCEVFSNIRAEDIRISESKSEGLRALKTFMHYSETGELDRPTPSGREPMSPFEEAVLEKIRQHGYKAVPQVGSAGFFVDIGICDPENPDCFVLGIECDGAMYHSARCARDRDRLRQFVLENRRGWRIHRIWSTDWWRNPESELCRALVAIEEAIAVKGKSPIRKDQPQETLDYIPRKENESSVDDSTSIPYRFGHPNVSLLNGEELKCVPPKRMAGWILDVVNVESPVHIDEIARRIREAAGLGRTGTAIHQAIRIGVNYLKKEGNVIKDREFVWKTPKHDSLIRNRSLFPPQFKKLKWIHAEEIKTSILYVVNKSFGISRIDGISMAMERLGFERITEEMRKKLNRLVQDLISSGVILEQEDLLKIK